MNKILDGLTLDTPAIDSRGRKVRGMIGFHHCGDLGGSLFMVSSKGVEKRHADGWNAILAHLDVVDDHMAPMYARRIRAAMARF